MSLIVDSTFSWLQSLIVKILKTGPIPKHVAFIMDGNRRFAKKAKLPEGQGHAEGFSKLAESLRWCTDLGIKEITVYAFSLENFKRTEKEVEYLITLTKNRLSRMINEDRNKIMKAGICIRFIGNMSYMDAEFVKLSSQVVLMTKENKGIILNIAFSYTSTEEITNSMKVVLKGVEEGKLQISDINENLLSSCMYSAEMSSPPDLLVRTSGEVRLSDFLLWQTAAAQLYFIKVPWPRITPWNLLDALLTYQRNYAQLAEMRRDHRQLSSDLQPSCDRTRYFVKQLIESRYDVYRSSV